MLTDVMEYAKQIENEKPCVQKKPTKEMTIHTIMGDMRRWYEGNVYKYSDYKIDEQKYLLLKAYYDEKEGATDDRK